MCTNISLKLYQLHVTIIQSMQYHLLTHHWEMGRGKGKMGEIVRKKSKAGHVRTLENGHRGRQVKGGLFRNTADRGQVDVATPGYIR